MEWSDKQIERLRELWDAGHSTDQIAIRLGVTKNAVVGKAHRLGVPGRPSPIRMEWSDAQIERLRELWAEGHSTEQIAMRMGVSKNSVVGKSHRLDLPARPSPIRAAGSGQPRKVTLPPLAYESPPAVAAAPAVEFEWTEKAEAYLRERWFTEDTTASIRRAVGAREDSHVVQKGYRMGLGSRQARTVLIASSPRETVTPRPAPPPPRGRVITCFWPIGDPRTHSFRFCDAESVPGKPYCSEHAQLAYVKVRHRREDADDAD